MKLAAILALCIIEAAQGQSLPPRGPDRVNWWNDRVFYEIFVRSFADSKEGPLAGDGIGDLQGIIERLDYLNDGNPDTTTDLGIGGIWLMPINPAPSYHGYDVTDYYSIDPEYGTIDDFKRLMSECHKRGINVIIDLVMNHCSHKHEWFTSAADPASKTRDWFIWSDTDPGWKGPWNQRVWHRLAGAGPGGADAYYYGLFSHTMPDFNFRNAGVTEVMKQVCFTWLSSYRVDGFRLDAIRHLIEEGQVQQNTPSTHGWLKDWFMEIKGINLDAMTIGEVWADSEQASSYVGRGMDLAFEFALADAMIAAARTESKDEFVRAQKRVLELYPPNQYGRFLSNHDQTRVMTQLRGDASAMRAAAVLLLTGPGVPFVYYGEEIGMTGEKPDEKLRTPMHWSGEAHAGFTRGTPWAEVKAGSESVNIEKQSGDPGSLLSLYRRLIHLRNAHPAIATGDMRLVETSRPGVAAYLRHRTWRDSAGAPQRTDSALVVVNLTGAAVEDVSLALGESPLRKELSMHDELNTNAAPILRLDERGAFTDYRPGPLPARGAMVLVPR